RKRAPTEQATRFDNSKPGENADRQAVATFERLSRRWRVSPQGRVKKGRSLQGVERDDELKSIAQLGEKRPVQLFVEWPHDKAGAVVRVFFRFLLPAGSRAPAHFFVIL